MKKLWIGATLLGLSLLAGTAAADVPAFTTMVQEGKSKLSFRYRYEDVDQDGFNKDAGASTVRTRFTWNSAPMQGFSLGLEVDYVSVIGSERYNSTENGNTEYPVVADPEGLDLNQSFIKYSGENVVADFGRQRILHGSQRFVGGVGWRQNEQTFDGLRMQFEPAAAVKVDYSYVWNVNRIFGPDDGVQPADWHGDSHFLTGSWKLADKHTLEGFAYLLDFENGNGRPNSTETYGIGYKGTIGPVKLTGTIATQSDYADSPLDYDADFYSLQADVKVSGFTLTAGYEVLGSDDGVAAFRTPLATLHKFQGWTDKFLLTPRNGIEDMYFGFKGKIGPVAVAATWHDFSADEGSMDYGTELDLVATYKVHEKVTTQFKFADYQEDGFSTDTTKFWLSLIVQL